MVPTSEVPALTRNAPVRMTSTSPRFIIRLEEGLITAILRAGPLFPLHHLAVDPFKVFFFVMFLGRGLDDPDTGDVFPRTTRTSQVGRLLYLGEKAGAPPGDQKDQQAHEGKKEKQHQCEHRVQGEGDETCRPEAK